MGVVIDLFDPSRYCLNLRCRRVDCDRHCWGCGSAGFVEPDFPFCKACAIELNTDEDIDLHGFWDPPEEDSLARQKRVYLDQSLEDILRDVGREWLNEQLGE
jgi:hypothetical protein